MKHYLILAVAATLTGCANTAAPNLYSGHYYMAGDKGCKKMSNISPTRIMCYDKVGNQTGYRDAMNDQQLQMWQIQVANQSAKMNELNASIEQLGQSAQNWEQKFRQQQYNAPLVEPITPYGRVTYTQVGSSYIGSNGVTYRLVGESLLGSDGTTCQIAGQHIICR